MPRPSIQNLTQRHGGVAMYIDSHAHFDLIIEEGHDDEEILIGNMVSRGVIGAVQVSITASGGRWSLEFAKRHAGRGILFTAGVHPSSPADDYEIRDLEDFATRVAGGKDAPLLFGIGECGLDFYRMRQPRKVQERSFLAQIALASRLGLPLIVQSRDAMEETLAILREARHDRGIMHCFAGDRDAARKVLDLGFHISFAGNVTYPGASHLRDAAAYVPADRLLVETDAPFLTPVPLRGRPNRSEYVLHAYGFIADLRGVPVDGIAAAVYENFLELRAHGAQNA